MSQQKQHQQPTTNNMIYSKVVLLGDQSGKTSIINRFIDNNNNNSTPDITSNTHTTGFITKQMSLIGDEFDNYQINFQIGDTSSDTKYHFLYKIFIKEASAIIFTFDITNPTSFENVKSLITKMLQYIKNTSMLVLVATKSDLKEKSQIDLSKARLFASDKSMLFKEVSAKTGQGVKDLFKDLGRIELYRRTGQSNAEKKVFTQKKGV